MGLYRSEALQKRGTLYKATPPAVTLGRTVLDTLKGQFNLSDLSAANEETPYYEPNDTLSGLGILKAKQAQEEAAARRALNDAYDRSIAERTPRRPANVNELRGITSDRTSVLVEYGNGGRISDTPEQVVLTGETDGDTFPAQCFWRHGVDVFVTRGRFRQIMGDDGNSRLQVASDTPQERFASGPITEADVHDLGARLQATEWMMPSTPPAASNQLALPPGTPQ